MGTTHVTALEVAEDVTVLGDVNVTGDVNAANITTMTLDEIFADLSAVVDYARTATGVNTLLAALADDDRTAIIVVRTTTVFANGDGAQPTFKIGTDTDDAAFMATAKLTGSAAGTIQTFAGKVLAGDKVIVTAVAATGTTSTGAIEVSIITAPIA